MRVVALLVGVVLAGCVSSRTTVLKISGTPRAYYTVRYAAGKSSGAVSSSTGGGAPSAVFEVPSKDASFEVIKTDPNVDLIAEIVEQGATVYRVEVPPGTPQMRIYQDRKGWRREPLQ